LPTPGSVEKQLRALGKTDIEIRKAMYIYRPEVMEGISHAQQLKRTYFSRLPNIQRFIYDCREYAKEFGYIRNWIGRKKRYNNPQQEAYKSVNALIQGGCAYILKTKLLEVAKFLEGKKSRIVNLIHDKILSCINSSICWKPLKATELQY
jgi:DNA polymerase I-like protein with 3'-5' exonuclease and polymerase domains